MQLFASYSRLDKPYCLQILSTLEVHEVWFDHRLYGGQQWWKEILRRLEWCEGFIYFLSPESIASEYCRKEYNIARGLGKHIFPVLIHDQTPLPSDLRELHYVDLSKGMTPEGVKALLSAIHLAERSGKSTSAIPVTNISSVDIRAPSANPQTAITEAALALEKNDFDRAVFLLKQLREKGYTSKFIDLEKLLRDAEESLEKQTYLREAEREYKQIAALVTRLRSSNLGCEAFHAFQKAFPDYDPQHLSVICSEAGLKIASVDSPALKKPVFSLPLLEWCEVPAGIITVENPLKNGSGSSYTFYVDPFFMSKYPVTNAQYQVFVDDPDGYCKTEWWQYSAHAMAWREKNPQPKLARFRGDDRPRENVTWYEAMAFCYWLSAKTGLKITLPSQQQWQRAVQGDDNRPYPWGKKFDSSRCNTRESGIKMTTPVNRYPDGVGPFGVFDLAGNVWEWCLNAEQSGDAEFDITIDAHRAVHGGSFIGVQERAQAGFRFYLSPMYFYATIGFRLVYTT